MSLFILALIVAAIICGILWRRPDARAVASGAWEAGKAQAIAEFRDGYVFAQRRLRSGDPSWKNPRRWLSGVLGLAYGTAATVVAANRIRRAAWNGARSRYQKWKASQPVDGEVIEEILVKPDRQPDPDPQPERPADGEKPSSEDDPDPKPEADPPPNPEPDPDRGPKSQQEGTNTMQTEAAGLTSYAAAHAQFASELRTQMSGSESLAASMANILAQHSDLIGDTAVLQDLLNQAAGIADRIAERSNAVANN